MLSHVFSADFQAEPKIAEPEFSISLFSRELRNFTFVARYFYVAIIYFSGLWWD
jgi:hypothetical protein